MGSAGLNAAGFSPANTPACGVAVVMKNTGRKRVSLIFFFQLFKKPVPFEPIIEKSS